MRLQLWGPEGQYASLEVDDGAGVFPALLEWCRSEGLRPGDVDYQVDKGVRMLGEASALAAGLDFCGLPRHRDPDA
jgi:hypothetical protein